MLCGWVVLAPYGTLALASLALASLDERASALALLRAEIVSQSNTILASHEAESRDSSLTWCEAKLVPTGVVASLNRAKISLAGGDCSRFAQDLSFA